MTNPTPESISQRVRFWEEQDAINQELIPRVIRQHELFTEHIGEHENLPAVVANAVQQAVAVAREEQRQLYESALETAKTEYTERASEQQQQYEAALESAKAEYNEQAENQKQQYETALETARRETRKMRDVFIGITAAIGAIAVAAALIAILVR